MRKLEIKESIVKEWEFNFSIAAIIVIIYKIKSPDIWIIIPIIFLLYVTYIIIHRLINRQPGVVIDKYGLHLKYENKSFPWELISDAEVENFNGEQIILKVKTKNSSFQTDLSNFNSNSYKIEEAIVFFSNGKIRGRETRFYDDINVLLSDKENLQVIIDLFRRHKRKVLWIGALIFFGGQALSIFLQVRYPFPYSFAIGWSAILIAMLFYFEKTELELRNSEKIRGLSDKQFNEIAIKFELRNNSEKKKRTLAMIFMVMITIGIFIISYLVTN
jgi:hypothetical protein